MKKWLHRLAPCATLTVLAVLVSAPAGAQTAPAAPTVAFSAPTFSAAPGPGFAFIGVSLSGTSAAPVVVTLGTFDGTAIAGVDYTAVLGTLIWAADDPPLKIIAIPVAGGRPGSTSFEVALMSASGANFGAQLLTTVTIAAGNAASANNGSVTLSWSAPNENTDGSALTDLAGYNIYYGTSAYTMTSTVGVNSAALQSCAISGLAPGTWYFEITAIDLLGEESGPSAVVSITL